MTRRYSRTYKGNDVQQSENFLNNKNINPIELDFYMAGESWQID